MQLGVGIGEGSRGALWSLQDEIVPPKSNQMLLQYGSILLLSRMCLVCSFAPFFLRNCGGFFPSATKQQISNLNLGEHL